MTPHRQGGRDSGDPGPSSPGDWITCRVLDEPVSITVADATVRRMVSALLAGFPAAIPVAARPQYGVRHGDDGSWVVDTQGASPQVWSSLEEAAVALEWQLVGDALAARSDLLHLHGAALADPDGASSVLILGDSGSGKTTLTLTLMGLGFRPYADDVIFLDPRRLVPKVFPRAFHVGPEAAALAGPTAAATWTTDGLPKGHALPMQWATHDVPVGAVFVSRLRPGHEPQATRLSLPDAAVTILHYSGTLDRSPRFALRTVGRLACETACYALTVGRVEQTAALVSRTIARHAAER